MLTHVPVALTYAPAELMCAPVALDDKVDCGGVFQTGIPALIRNDGELHHHS